MAKITRKNFKVFGISGSTTNFAVYGSQRAASPVKSMDIETIQSLDAWGKGWTEAVNDDNKAPYLEDMNGAMLVMAYQLGYILQDGIPVWNADTTYYTDSVVRKDGTQEIYCSLIDTNLNQALPSKVTNSKWTYLVDLEDIVPNGSITESKIANLAVTEGKIGALAVTEGKIGALSVTSGKIGALAVTEAKIDSLAVTEGKIGALSVTNGKIGAAAVTGAKLSSDIDYPGYARKSTTALARAFLYADQVMTSSPGKIDLTNVNIDLRSNFDTTNKRFVCPVVGYYKITACANNSTATVLYVSFNGFLGAFEATASPGNLGVTIVDIIHCTTPGDYIELWGQYGTFKGNAYGTYTWCIFELIA
jgi:hypothetical protein